MPGTDNYVSVRQAADDIGATTAAVRRLIEQGLVRGVRIGTGRFRVNLDDVRAMRVEYPREHDHTDERIAELVSGAPEFSTAQINRLRLLLHAAPAVSR